jgi:hypothetical protein
VFQQDATSTRNEQVEYLFAAKKIIFDAVRVKKRLSCRLCRDTTF